MTLLKLMLYIFTIGYKYNRSTFLFYYIHVNKEIQYYTKGIFSTL